MNPTIYSLEDHGLDLTSIDRDALFVIRRLREAGYIAYLVGGGVRDLLLKKTPKDFDISTSARPEEIKRLFGRQCILIGRRFRLAHIRFGHKILEVSTFRSGEMTEDLITRDNVWGTEQEDVLRRDFTINGLFYNPENQSVIDYVGGWNDLQKGVLETIGDPEVRFKQDPVRMIRLIKFQARFDFNVSKNAANAMHFCLDEITKSSPARVLEEMFRMLESSNSAKFFELLQGSGLMKYLAPPLAKAFESKKGQEINQFLASCDQINLKSTRFPIERPVLAAALLFPLLEEEVQKTAHLGQILEVTSLLIKDFMLASFSHFPKRISALMHYVLSTQYRLTPLQNKKHHPIRMFRIREFPMALRLLKVRAIVHPELQNTYIEWRENYRHFLRDQDRHSHTRRGSSPRKSYEEMAAKQS